MSHVVSDLTSPHGSPSDSSDRQDSNSNDKEVHVIKGTLSSSSMGSRAHEKLPRTTATLSDASSSLRGDKLTNDMSSMDYSSSRSDVIAAQSTSQILAEINAALSSNNRNWSNNSRTLSLDPSYNRRRGRSSIPYKPSKFTTSTPVLADNLEESSTECSF